MSINDNSNSSNMELAMLPREIEWVHSPKPELAEYQHGPTPEQESSYELLQRLRMMAWGLFAVSLIAGLVIAWVALVRLSAPSAEELKNII